MATFVLIHGGCHGGWCYSRVAAMLRAHKHEVYAPTLAGVGERLHLAAQAINLSSHIREVVSILEANDLRDVVLCGHSYGGMVTTGVAGQVGERIRTLFYIDGCVPDDGQSLCDIVGPERSLAMLEAAGANGTMMDPPSAKIFGVNPADVEWVDKMCTPHPIACFVEKLRLTGKEALVPRRTYVLCEHYRSTSNYPTYAKVRNNPDWKAASLSCGHDAMIDAPAELTKLLLAELD